MEAFNLFSAGRDMLNGDPGTLMNVVLSESNSAPVVPTFGPQRQLAPIDALSVGD